MQKLLRMLERVTHTDDYGRRRARGGRVSVAAALVFSVWVVATQGTSGLLLAPPVLAGSVWLARRLGGRASRPERMTTDPWQVEEPPQGGRGRKAP